MGWDDNDLAHPEGVQWSPMGRASPNPYYPSSFYFGQADVLIGPDSFELVLHRLASFKLNSQLIDTNRVISQ